ncbi:MAG: endonuclease domain-containing protein [Thermomicrobiales bacterium]
MRESRATPQDRWQIPEPLRRVMVRIARDFRKAPTHSEQILWEHLRGRKLAGTKFRRQQPIGPFVVDFCAPSLRLVVEVDGPIHDALEEHKRDAERQHLIERLGFRFIRVRAADVEHNIEEVLEQIERAIAEINRSTQ